MALNWLWSDICGEITLEQTQEDGSVKQFPIRLYTGNAYLIMLSENDEDDTYQMYSFFLDKDHAKRCFGLDKKGGNTENTFDKGWSRWTKVRLNKAKFSHTKELVTMLAQAFDDITIEIYSDKEEGRRGKN